LCWGWGFFCSLPGAVIEQQTNSDWLPPDQGAEVISSRTAGDPRAGGQDRRPPRRSSRPIDRAALIEKTDTSVVMQPSLSAQFGAGSRGKLQPALLSAWRISEPTVPYRGRQTTLKEDRPAGGGQAAPTPQQEFANRGSMYPRQGQAARSSLLPRPICVQPHLRS